MTAAELGELRGLTDPIQLSEVKEIYLPLSRLLRLYYAASAALRRRSAGSWASRSGLRRQPTRARATLVLH